MIYSRGGGNGSHKSEFVLWVFFGGLFLGGHWTSFITDQCSPGVHLGLTRLHESLKFGLTHRRIPQ